LTTTSYNSKKSDNSKITIQNWKLVHTTLKKAYHELLKSYILINLTPWNEPKEYCIEIHNLWASTSIKYLLKFSLCSALWTDLLPIWNGTASTVWSLYGKSMQNSYNVHFLP
jgi:hypothetical protein